MSESVTETVGFDTQSWLIAVSSVFLGAIVGGIVSHVLTMRMTEKRALSLTSGFYNEFEVTRSYFVLWLGGLLDEYRNQKRTSITEFADIDTSCIDSLTTELIASGVVLSIDQRQLILSLKKKYETILEFSRDRSSKSYNEGSGFFIAKRSGTVHLILEAVEVIFYLSQLLTYREKFKISGCENWLDTSEDTLKMVGVKLDADEWDSIKKYSHEST